jgi:hypothetical protein
LSHTPATVRQRGVFANAIATERSGELGRHRIIASAAAHLDDDRRHDVAADDRR